MTLHKVYSLALTHFPLKPTFAVPADHCLGMSFYILLRAQFGIALSLSEVTFIQATHTQEGPNAHHHLPESLRIPLQLQETHSPITTNLQFLDLSPPCLLIMVGDTNHVIPIIEFPKGFHGLYSEQVHLQAPGIIFAKNPELLRAFIQARNTPETRYRIVRLEKD